MGPNCLQSLGAAINTWLVPDRSREGRQQMKSTPFNKMVFSARAPIVQELCESRVAIVQELCESRGGRPGLSVLTSLLVSVDVKLY